MRTVLLASLRTHTRRYVAAAVAVVISVTFVVTVAALSSAARDGLTSAVGAPYAGSDVVVTDVEPRAVPSLLEAAARTDARVEVLGTAYVPVRTTADAGPDTSSSSPVDALADVGQIGTAEQDPWRGLTTGRYPAGPGEAVVDAHDAAEARVAVGDRLVLGQGSSSREVTVVGLAEPSYTVSSNAVYVTTADLAPFARELYVEALGWGGPGSTADHEATVAAAAPDATLTPASAYVGDRAAQATRGVDVVSLLLLLFAAVALFVAVLVIGNSFAILVAQRQRELALLRCVGATRAKVRRSVRLESLVLGVVASAVGLVAGTATGAGVVALVGDRLPDAPLGAADVSWRWYGAAAVVGVGVTLVAAWLPTRRATAVSPLAALRPEPVVDARSSVGRRRLVAGLVGLVAGSALLVLAVSTRDAVVMVGGGAVAATAVLLLGPVLVPLSIRLVGRVAGALPGPVGLLTRLAADNAVRNPRRTAATAASLLVGVTLTTAVLTGLASVRGAVDTEISTAHPLDAALTSAAGTPSAGGLDDALVDRVAAVDGVDAAVGVPGTTASDRRLGDLTVLAPSPAEVNATSYGDAGALLPAAGTAYLPVGVLGEDGVVPRRVQLTVGDRSETFRAELAPGEGGWGSAVLVAPESLARLTDAPVTAAVWARAEDGTDAGALTDALDTLTTAAGAGATLSGGYDSRAAADLQLDVVTGAVVGLLGISVVIALVGIGNTLGLSVLERVREHALLRALGLTRRQLRATLGAEALLLSVVVTVLGTLVGTAFGWVGVQVLVRQVVETAPLVMPWGQLALVVLASAVAAVLAAVLPARRAARTAPAAGLALD